MAIQQNSDKGSGDKPSKPKRKRVPGANKATIKPNEEHAFQLMKMYGVRWVDGYGVIKCATCGVCTKFINKENNCLACVMRSDEYLRDRPDKDDILRRIVDGNFVYHDLFIDDSVPYDCRTSRVEIDDMEDLEFQGKASMLAVLGINPVCLVPDGNESDPAAEMATRAKMLELGLLSPPAEYHDPILDGILVDMDFAEEI